MNEAEYRNILENENSYWWYLILDDLVEYFAELTIGKNQIQFLDTGCGTGRIIKKLSRFGTAFGIDSSPIAIEICKSQGLVNVEVADLNEWSSDNKFNMIVSLDVLYHQSFNNVRKIFMTFNNALKSNGTLILNLPAFNILKRQHDIAVGGNERFRKKELKETLEDSGFKVLTSTYRYPLLFKFILLRKLFSKKKNEISSDLKTISPLMNKILFYIHKIENEFIKMGFSFPFGSSVFIVANKETANLGTSTLSESEKSMGFWIKFKFYIKSRQIYNQLFKYSFVGIFNTLIGLSGIYLLYNIFHFNYIIANIGGYSVGLINSFIWNKRWTFESKRHYTKEIIPFLIVFVISYFINLLVVIISVELMKVNPNYAQIIGIAAYSSTNFLINRYWTFSKR